MLVLLTWWLRTLRHRFNETRGDNGKRERKGRKREEKGREEREWKDEGGRKQGRWGERELNHLSSEVKHSILFVRNESLMPALVEQVSNHHKFFGFSLCSTSLGEYNQSDCPVPCEPQM